MNITLSEDYIQNLCADMMSAMANAAPHDLDKTRHVSSLFDHLAGGGTVSDFLDLYPHLTRNGKASKAQARRRHLAILAMADVLDQEEAICHDDLWDETDSDLKNDFDYDDFFDEDGQPVSPHVYYRLTAQS